MEKIPKNKSRHRSHPAKALTWPDLYRLCTAQARPLGDQQCDHMGSEPGTTLQMLHPIPTLCSAGHKSMPGAVPPGFNFLPLTKHNLIMLKRM